MAGCIKEVKRAMRVSSLKGLPRIMIARNHFDRTIWTVAVICFFCVCMVTVHSNIAAYLAYPKIVNVEEKLIQTDDPNGTVPFPTIAVCNTNPFSSSRSDFENIPLPKDYYKKVLEMTSCQNCSKENAKLASFLRKVLMTNRGYYQYAGMEAMIQMSDPNLVLQCLAIVRTGSSYMAYPCEDYTRNYTFVHPDVGVCYAYEVQPLPEHLDIVGYSFMLHLDNSDENLNTEYDPTSIVQPLSGAIIFTYDPYVIPNTLVSSSLIAPGMATTFYIKAVRTDRLSKPYSDRDCIKEGDEHRVFYDNKYFEYDLLNCLGECTLQYSIKHCNCTDLLVLQNPEYKPPAKEYCASLRQSVDDLYTNMHCAERVKKEGHRKCIEKCKEPCKEIKYILRSSIAKWPLPSQIGSFYNNVILNNTNLYRQYQQFEETAKAMAGGDSSISPMDRALIAKAIEDNFGLAVIYIADPYYTHYESKPKITIDALISQLGGSFNLWSGITVMIFVEIVDLIIKLLSHLGGEVKRTTVAEDSEIEVN